MIFFPEKGYTGTKRRGRGAKNVYNSAADNVKKEKPKRKTNNQITRPS